MLSMRELMLMVEMTERPREGPPVPDMLYHGTSLSAWEMIQSDNTMIASDHRDEESISFTTDWHTAQRFALQGARRDGDDSGVVIEFNGDDLARKFNVKPFSDTGLIHAESEWRIDVSEITQVNRYISGVEKVGW